MYIYNICKNLRLDRVGLVSIYKDKFGSLRVYLFDSKKGPMVNIWI